MAEQLGRVLFAKLINIVKPEHVKILQQVEKNPLAFYEHLQNKFLTKENLKAKQIRENKQQLKELKLKIHVE